MHHGPLIAIIVAGLGLAFVFGAIAQKLRISPLVGYLLAGVAAGPFTPGFVGDQNLANELAEIGVILLMFGVGLHFSLKELLSVKAIAVPGAIVQIAVATLLGLGLALLLGWNWTAGLVFGIALSTASTVVLLRALQERRLVQTEKGKIAVGWLIVEDLAMVLALVAIPAVASAINGGQPGASSPLAAQFDLGLWGVLGITVAKVAAFIAFMLIVGRRVIPWALHWVAHTGSRELFRLAVLAVALGVAFLSATLFGVSFALGAFFAGMILSESPLSQRAAEETLPLRDAFAVLFFVSVGMLFDPSVLVEQPLRVLLVVGIIVVGKSVAAALLVLLMGYPLSTALSVSAALAQIGEFSFILIGLGLALDLLPRQGQSLVLAGALISIALNPLVFSAIEPLRAWLGKRSQLARRLEKRDDPLAELPMSTDRRYLANQVVIVGYGRVGRQVGEALREQGVPFVVADENRELVERLRAQGQAAVFGDAAEPETLVQAHIVDARMLVIATPQTIQVRQMVETARTLNPDIGVLVRSHNEVEAGLLAQDSGAQVFVGERELARAMAQDVLRRMHAQ